MHLVHPNYCHVTTIHTYTCTCMIYYVPNYMQQWMTRNHLSSWQLQHLWVRRRRAGGGRGRGRGSLKACLAFLVWRRPTSSGSRSPWTWCRTTAESSLSQRISPPSQRDYRMDSIGEWRLLCKYRISSKSRCPRNVAASICQLIPINAALEISPHGKGSTAISVCTRAFMCIQIGLLLKLCTRVRVDLCRQI